MREESGKDKIFLRKKRDKVTRTNHSTHFSLYFYTPALLYSPFLFRKVRELLSYNLMYEQWLEFTPRMFVLSFKAAVLYEIKKGENRSTEVQKYGEKHENDFTL